MESERQTVDFVDAEHCAFFYEDSYLMLIRFSRDDFRLLFLIDEAEAGHATLVYPGELFDAQVRDRVEAVFFVELTEADGTPQSLALGAFFPVDDAWYGAFYPRGQEAYTLYFLRVVGEGAASSLEAVEDEQEHQRVAEVFRERYRGFFAFDR